MKRVPFGTLFIYSEPSVCKPGSVERLSPPGDHFSGSVIAHALKQPTRGSNEVDASHRLLGLAPAGVYRAARVATDAVGSYPTISPLPPLSRWRSVFCGTVRRILIRPGITWQPVHGARTFLDEVCKQGPHRDRPTDDSSQPEYNTFRAMTRLCCVVTHPVGACFPARQGATILIISVRQS